ncbi:hypothetical protein ymoll0001_40860 [Yersinia mollaretii ATCC 43969]|uniref:Uncharacterized protein n=1 Tax=Yersinia mollaretii (strain ATCC 43969 / DSM 18520 / CIP 103324 / CNY 7263 / WAIP 204) TaxID=349967 RepID=A0ABM9Y4U3_YERMW|nr:hypothetical protein ymoll0001_40860 [Yersinia mollaretii ATCC 43969]
MKSGFCDITQLLNLYDKLLLRRPQSSHPQCSIKGADLT